MTFKIFMRKKAIDEQLEFNRQRNLESVFHIQCPICKSGAIMVSELGLKHETTHQTTCGHVYRFKKGNLEVDYPETVKKAAPKKKSTPKKKPVEKKVKSKKSSKKDD